MPRYLLVDSVRTLARAYDLFGKPLPIDLIIVAATAAGILACEQAQVAYTTIERFSSRKDIIDLGWRNYSELTDFCEYWDRIAQEKAPCLRERGIKPFRFGYYDLKILIDSIAVKILLLCNFVKEVGDQDIYFAPEPQREIVSGDFLRPCKDVNIFSVLLEAFFKHFAQIKPLPPSSHQAGVSLSFIYYVGIKGGAKRVGNLIRNVFLSLNRKHGRPFLLFNSGHDIGYLLPILRSRGFYPIHIPPPSPICTDVDIQTECNNLWITLCGNSDFINFFSYGDIGYLALIERALRSYFESVLPSAIAHYDQMQEDLTKSNPSFSLTGTINLGLIQRCRMLAAQGHQIPLVTYTEGAGYGGIISPIYDYTEVCDGDVMLCYGKGNVEYYEDIGCPVKRLIPVGSAHQEAIRERYKARMPSREIHTVMYVGTLVDDSIVHLPNNGLISTCYCMTQLKIFRLLATLPKELDVVAKLHPGDVISNEMLRLPEFNRIRLESDRFEEVMEGIDLFIIDFPSTVLLSAISTSAYVFVLVEEGGAGFTQKQRDRLEKRAYLFEQFDELAESTHGIVSDTGLYPPRLGDDYMWAYSLFQQDAKAANKAVDAIDQLSRSHA